MRAVFFLAAGCSTAAAASALRGAATVGSGCLPEYSQCLGPNDDNTNECCGGLYCDVTSPGYYGQCVQGSAGDDTPSSGDDTPSSGDDNVAATVVTTEAELNANLKSNTVVKLGADITLTKSVTIDGPKGLTICGQGKYALSGAGQVHVFLVKSGQVRIQNLTVTGGYAQQTDGGGLTLTGGDVTLYNVDLTNNTALLGKGGALAASNGNLAVLESRLTNNQAEYGGGFFFSGATAAFTNCEVSGNVGTFGGGGRVQGGALTLKNTNFKSNAATGAANAGGGALSITSGVVTLDSCLVSYNAATATGGGLLLSSEWPVVNLVNYAFQNNAAADGADVYKSGTPQLHLYSNCAADKYNDGPSGGPSLSCAYDTGAGVAACPTAFPAVLMGSPCAACASGTFACCGHISATCAAAEPTCSADQNAVCP